MNAPTSEPVASAIPAPPQRLRVLIVRIGAMGDVLHAMPAVAGLRAAMPDCFIGWAIEPMWMPLLQAEDGTGPMVDRVHAVPARKWKRNLFSLQTARELAALQQDLRAEQYDICIDLQGSIKSALVGWMSGAKRFAGPANARESMAVSFYGESVTVSAPHVIEQACELLTAAVAVPVTASSLVLPTSNTAAAWCRSVLPGVAPRTLGTPPQDARQPEKMSKSVLIVPTAGWGAKEWGVSRYSQLATKLLDQGIGVLINAAGPDSQVPQEIARSSGATLVPSSIPQLMALTRCVSLVVGGDTGPIHLAAALGCPVVALFGPTDPARNGPSFPGSKVTVLRDPSSVTSHKRHGETEAGLERIRVEEVLAVALAMLEVEQDD